PEPGAAPRRLPGNRDRLRRAGVQPLRRRPPVRARPEDAALIAKPVLVVRDLSVRFDTDDGPVHAVDRLSFTLAAQEVLGIVGESGCGKSVSVLSLLGLLPPTASVSGQAAFGDIDLLKASRARLRRIRGKEVSFVFQEPMT